PDRIAMPQDPADRARWLREAVVIQEITTFDDAVVARMVAYGDACGDLARAAVDPIAAARRVLDAARAYWTLLLSHRDWPAGAYREGAEHHARAMARNAVVSYETFLGVGVANRIYVEVFRDREADDARCARCGGPLAAGEAALTALARCPHCGAVAEVDR